MIFVIDDIWYGKNCSTFQESNQKITQLIDWLEENVGWVIGDFNPKLRCLPIYGEGWRIEYIVDQYEDNDYTKFSITLTIDSDSLAIQYKLTFE